MAKPTKQASERRIPNIIVLTGAGASVPLGLPDTKGLIQRLTGLRGDLEAFLGRIVASHEGGKPDVEWILERLDLYEDLERLLGTDRNVGAEASRTVKDVLKRCKDAAERVRSAFPRTEWVNDPQPNSVWASGLASRGMHSPNPSQGGYDDTPYLVLNARAVEDALGGHGARSAYNPLIQRAPDTPESGHWKDVKPPPYEPGVDSEEMANGTFAGLGDQARRLRDTIYDNILRIYNSVDGDTVATLYRPLMEPLWGIAGSYGGRLRVFTTNWDPSFIALSDATDLPITTGMTGTSYEPYWNPSVYDAGKLDVYYLHGCCRWVTKRASPGRILYSPLPLEKHSEYEVPVLYRPRSKNGVIADEPYASAYAALDRALVEPAVVLVIGYSFRDEPIQHVLERAAVRGTVKKLVVLDPAKTLPIPEELAGVTKRLRMKFGEPRAIRAVIGELLSGLGVVATPLAERHTQGESGPRRPPPRRPATSKAPKKRT